MKTRRFFWDIRGVSPVCTLIDSCSLSPEVAPCRCSTCRPWQGSASIGEWMATGSSWTCDEDVEVMQTENLRIPKSCHAISTSGRRACPCRRVCDAQRAISTSGVPVSFPEAGCARSLESIGHKRHHQWCLMCHSQRGRRAPSITLETLQGTCCPNLDHVPLRGSAVTREAPDVN
jgi:hypothetical protein